MFHHVALGASILGQQINFSKEGRKSFNAHLAGRPSSRSQKHLWPPDTPSTALHGMASAGLVEKCWPVPCLN